MTSILIIIVALAAAVAVLVFVIRQKSTRIKILVDGNKNYTDEISKLLADKARLVAALEDIKIIEEKKNDDETEIMDADSADTVAGILNELFNNSRPTGDSGE